VSTAGFLKKLQSFPIKSITSSGGSIVAPTMLHNLCLCCIHCNLKKGPDIASIDPATGILVALYHPRYHSWREHFTVAIDGAIQGLTAEGRATVQLLDMNGEDRVRLRALLLRRNRYP
jgi:hypothetical protein